MAPHEARSRLPPGSALKDEPTDVSRLRGYLERQVKARKGLWADLYAHRHIVA